MRTMTEKDLLKGLATCLISGNLWRMSKNARKWGKMSDEEKMNLFELTLPKYLKNDIEALEDGIRNKSTLIDCLWSEVYGSINSAFYDNEISN